MKAFNNHLANETSPYLLQHATNPVDWYPWGDAALARAKEENKPILLSIGYAACHWCHVMAHESFEDEETALLMNRWFINIKVDKEERPDLDKIYQAAHHILSQHSGGWPLTVFLEPHHLTPFYTGTYFPKEPRYGLPAFKQILQGAANLYDEKPAAILAQGQQLKTLLFDITQTEESTYELSPATLAMAYHELEQQFDSQYGGFGFAPKFPQPSYLLFLLNHYVAHKQDTQTRRMVDFTLTKMAQGGIYDQLGGGFYRYSVDEKWEIPHFEKMLYDNAQLLTDYAAAFALSNNALYKQILQETATWLIKDMQAVDGGFYATRDADSEGEEGKYYYWKREELKSLLSTGEYSTVLLYFNFAKPANFEDHWHLHINQSIEAVAKQLNIPITAAQMQLASAKQKMLQARTDRIPPLRDEKILTAWNGLAIKGMAYAGLYLQEQNYIASAQKAVDFIRQNLWQDGRLLACYKDGQAKYKAYLDDYAFMLDALLALLQANWRSQDLQFAIELADALLAYYKDEKQGGFFFTAHDHETLIQRPKPFFDEALPAGNSIAALALNRLGYLVGNLGYIGAAEHTLKAASHYLQQAPHGCASLLGALQDYLKPPTIIILRGNAELMKVWHTEAVSGYNPDRLCFSIPENESDLPEKLAMAPNINQVTAYICHGQLCLAPITEFKDFKYKLNNEVS